MACPVCRRSHGILTFFKHGGEIQALHSGIGLQLRRRAQGAEPVTNQVQQPAQVRASTPPLTLQSK